MKLIDLVAVVVGFSLAALLLRAFWPSSGAASGAAFWALLGLVLTWLGTAMAGPLVLVLDRPLQSLAGRAESRPQRHTWAEQAWLIIGLYWLVVAGFVVPIRMPVSPWLGVFPLVVALGLRTFARRPATAARATERWTHRVALGLLVAWPIAWIALILLARLAT